MKLPLKGFGSFGPLEEEYSPEEIVLLKHYGYDNVAEHIAAPGLYRMMVEKAFLANDQSEYAHALRRGASALSKSNPLRMTPEFNALVRLVPTLHTKSWSENSLEGLDMQYGIEVFPSLAD